MTVDDLDPNRTALIMGPFLGLLSAPVVFQIVRVVEQDSSLRSDLIASVVTTILCLAFILLIKNYLIQSCHLKNTEKNMKAYQQESFIHRLISVLTFDDSSNTKSNPNSSFSFLQSDYRNASDQNNDCKRKIDSKYFKPKFIINELLTFWGTTCTVITWGSFYVIGGTIMATERIAQKIKAKRTSSRDNSFNNSFSGFSNRTTDQNDSFMNMSFRSTSNNEDIPNGQSNGHHTFKRISSWTKRSYNSIKKKFSRVVTTSVPHFSSLTSPLNTSNQNS